MTTVFTWALQTALAKNEASELVKLNIEDVREDILDASNKNLLELTKKIASRLNSAEKADSAKEKQISAQQSIPYHEMAKEGICRVQD